MTGIEYVVAGLLIIVVVAGVIVYRAVQSAIDEEDEHRSGGF